MKNRSKIFAETAIALKPMLCSRCGLSSDKLPTKNGKNELKLFLGGLFLFYITLVSFSIPKTAPIANAPANTFFIGVQTNGVLPVLPDFAEDVEVAPTTVSGTWNTAEPPQAEPSGFCALGVYITKRVGDAPALGFLGLTSPPKISPSKTSPFLKWYFNWKLAPPPIGGITFVPLASKSWLNVYDCLPSPVALEKFEDAERTEETELAKRTSPVQTYLGSCGFTNPEICISKNFLPDWFITVTGTPVKFCPIGIVGKFQLEALCVGMPLYIFSVSALWMAVYVFIKIKVKVRDKYTNNFLTFYSFEKTDRAWAKSFNSFLLPLPFIRRTKVAMEHNYWLYESI
ncbi:MAG: hypothetical protein QG594_548 [Bacteroidota bacterium]|nr:hypothetical protein [Bacteroidota bacterium]